MKNQSKYIFFLTINMAMIACNKDDIRDPYQPVTLPAINQLNFIYGNDSSVFIFDDGMILTSGRDNTLSVSAFEWFAMEYADADRKQLSGALYKTASDPTAHMTERKVTYSRDDRNMLAKLTREEWDSKSFSFSYDEQYRLSQLTLNMPNTVNRYTITYDDLSNVATVESYRKVSDIEGTDKYEFSGYEKSNPFYFLVNVFYAPVFSSNNGTVFFDKMSSSLGLLLSKNNPGKVVKYAKNGNKWEESGSDTYSYLYDAADKYPVHISGGNLELTVEYK